MITAIRRAIALWLLREELSAEWKYVLDAHDAVEGAPEKVERYWMGRVTAIDRIAHGKFALDGD